MTMTASGRRHQALYANLHDDWSLEVHKAVLNGETGVLDELYGPKVKAGNIGFTFYTVGGDDTVFTYDKDLLRGTLRSIDAARRELARSSLFRLCLNADDVLEAQADARVGVMFTIEGAGPLDEDLSMLRTLSGLGLRSVILTWFKANRVADGVGETRNGGLTNFGREVVAEMGRLGLLIDISQCAPASTNEVLAIAKGPIIASHSNCCGVYPHRRNLSDEQLSAIADTGGLIGITAFPAHVGPTPTLDRFLDHVEYAADLMGVEHVSLGLNIVVHGDRDAVSFYKRSAIDYSSLYLKDLEDLDKFSNVAHGLTRRGWRPDDIDKVMGSNILRVLRLVKPASAYPQQPAPSSES